MADGSPTATTELSRLLAEPGAEPARLAVELAAAREAAELDAPTRFELDRIELAFLSAQGSTGPLRNEVAWARFAARQAETRIAAARPDDEPAALFDLAEQRAAYRLEGAAAEAAAVLTEIERRREVVAVDARTLEEARERYATLSTEEDLPLQHKILLLEESAAVFARLAERAAEGGKAVSATKRQRNDLRRMSARTRRSANDRTLTQRLERMLTPRGAKALEATSLAFLVVVFALLLGETWFDPPPATVRAFRFVDGAICLFFIAEFALKFSLSPARGSWFLRNVLTDLLPAIPAVLWIVPDEAALEATSVTAVRLVRLFRITYFARYFNQVRPLLRMLRLLLFLVKGLDGLVQRFAPLLNRNFVFFEKLSLRAFRTPVKDLRELAFRALRREHVLLGEADPAAAAPVLSARAQALRDRLQQTSAEANHRVTFTAPRDIPVETAIQVLYNVGVDDVTQFLSRRDLGALDRVVRVLSAPVVRSLPFIRNVSLRGGPLPKEAAERVVCFGRNVARYLERWRSRAVFFADLHGIVTGPQLLDRVATAMVKASQRPAVRLLLFGALFFLARALVGANSGPGQFLGRFVGAPLVILGSVCAVFLSLGWWFKRLAGEASESFKLTAEAQFIVLLDHLKTRREVDDAAFLARRVFRDVIDPATARDALLATMAAVRTGEPVAVPAAVPVTTREELHQVALLHLHFLDGSPLHRSDVKTTEQILANPSLENLRAQHLRTTKRERKQLRKLSLSDGSIMSGPYMWFTFITESAAVEAAKRITEYNRYCLTLEQRRVGTADEIAAFEAWVVRRRNEMAGRTLRKLSPPGGGDPYSTTEFCALDFLSTSREREAHLRHVFGDEILELVRVDRQRMIREIFGMRPLHRLPRSQRSVNVYTTYQRWLSRGRILLLPLFALFLLGRAIGRIGAKTAAVVREILRPQAAARRQATGRAPFRVALRKIHRMKAPGLLEAMRLRAGCDPEYSGAPTTWSDGRGFEVESELSRDMDFLHLEERDREEFRAQQDAVRERIQRLQQFVAELGPLGDAADELARRHGERAVSMAWITDRDRVRTLAEHDVCLRRAIAVCEAERPRRPWLHWCWRLLRRCPNPIDALLAQHFATVPVTPATRRMLRNAWLAGEEDLRALTDVASTLSAGVDWHAEAVARMRVLWRKESVANRDLAVARAVQSLTVLDVRNYRELVFDVGEYAADGEDAALARSLP